MTAFRAVFFDVAHTLLHKPALYPAMQAVLRDHEIEVPLPELRARHRLLMEAMVFPDRTSREFYSEFNAYLLRALGVLPSEALLQNLFEACSYLPWLPFDDVRALQGIVLPMGILSNWDLTLKDRLPLVQGVEFDWVLGSAEQNLRKPDPAFFERIVESTGLDPAQIVYIGDSIRLDIEPAIRLGLHAVLIDRDGIFPHANVPRIASLTALEALL